MTMARRPTGVDLHTILVLLPADRGNSHTEAQKHVHGVTGDFTNAAWILVVAC